MFKQQFNPHKRFHNKALKKSVSSRVLLDAIASVEVIKKGKTPLVEEEVNTMHNSFEAFHLSTLLLQNIIRKGYTLPTPIQDKAIPAILKGQDVTGIANTGKGKTAAFLIPLINRVIYNPSERVLIIAPTRELAIQIQEELKVFSQNLHIHAILLIGGMSMHRQKGDLKQNPQFVIGTPGRIKDLLKEKSFSLSSFSTVVLDEADRMVDIGFINDIKYFISLLPHNRQSLFFSATIDGKVKEILHSFVHDPVFISVKQQDTAENIDQAVIEIPVGHRKIDKLHDLLAQEAFAKVLIFGRTKWGVQKLTIQLAERGFRVAAIHGNKNQNQRQRALQQFKRGEIQVLLATDVASRGLDIQDVSHVINYDMPATMEDYIHRIGRTGRADKRGKALTFIEK
jgi:superfamily II DNA/RNA helicase